MGAKGRRSQETGGSLLVSWGRCSTPGFLIRTTNSPSYFLQLLEQVLGPRAAFTMPSADDVEEVELVNVELKEDDHQPYQRTAYTRPMPNLFDPMEGDPRSCVPQWWNTRPCSLCSALRLPFDTYQFFSSPKEFFLVHRGRRCFFFSFLIFDVLSYFTR